MTTKRKSGPGRRELEGGTRRLHVTLDGPAYASVVQVARKYGMTASMAARHLIKEGAKGMAR